MAAAVPVAAANGLGLEGALAASTIEAARLLGIADRVGSLEVGKDGDLALFDGDPFEYATRCTGVVIEGEVMSRDARLAGAAVSRGPGRCRHAPKRQSARSNSF